jgi:alanyl-tRNA synthetase
VVIQQKGIEEAKAMGAMALFGEKYGDIVRVVKIGDYSLELCGGCHVRNSAEIGLFKIVSEAGIGAGTRRIEAVTGRYAYDRLNAFVKTLESISRQLKTPMDKTVERIEGLQQQIRDLEKEKESLVAKLSHVEASDLESKVKQENGISYLAEQVQGQDMNGLRGMMDQLKQQLGSGVIVLASASEGKVQLVAGVTKDLMEKGYHAGKLIKEVAERCGGSGGGRPDMAQAGGKDPSKVQAALNYVKEWVTEYSK